MTMITPSYLGETIEYSSLHACRSTLEDPTVGLDVVVLFLPVAPAAGPLSFRSPIWRSTMPMITATPMSTAPRNAAYPAPLATSARPLPRGR